MHTRFRKRYKPYAEHALPAILTLLHALRAFSCLVALSIRGGGTLFLATAFPVELRWR
jgi:hypothetical protein